MGYNTRYALEITLPVGAETAIQIRPCYACHRPETKEINLADMIYNELVMEDVTIDQVMGGRMDVCKWYEHEEEMKLISAKYPGTLFKLSSEGESARDIWVKYFMDGKVQHERAEILLAPFDRRKLK